MTKYRATRDYRSNHAAFTKDTTADVDDELADWVNRDSPGTLVKAAAKKAVAKKSTAAAKDDDAGGDDS